MVVVLDEFDMKGFHPEVLEMKGRKRCVIDKSRVINQGVFNFVVDSVENTGEKGGEGVDGEGTIPTVEGFPRTSSDYNDYSVST